jgi:hypothetical protein
VAKHLRERGEEVIACDLHDADVIGDLATSEVRAALVDGVRRLSGGRIDGIHCKRWRRSAGNERFTDRK